MYGALPLNLSMYHLHAEARRRNCTELELQMVSYHMDDENQTQVFWKSSKCS